jgi:archaellum biogenesis ATPase FlaH
VHIVYGFCDGIARVVLMVSRWEVREQVHSCHKHMFDVEDTACSLHVNFILHVNCILN